MDGRLADEVWWDWMWWYYCGEHPEAQQQQQQQQQGALPGVDCARWCRLPTHGCEIIRSSRKGGVRYYAVL